MTEPSINYNPGDNASSFERVEVRYPDAVQVNVGVNHVEWGSPRSFGMDGGDIELTSSQYGGSLQRFQESSRIVVMDRVGLRVYDSDSEKEDRLILRLDHADYHDGLDPVIGPAGLRTCTSHDADATDDELIERSKKGVVSYEQIMANAADLLQDTDDQPSEYRRGIAELTARLFGVEDLPTDERTSYIQHELSARLRQQ